ELLSIQNQKIEAAEAGYGFTSTMFSATLNAYLTLWKNKPLDFPGTINYQGELYTYNINGLDALHKGVELETKYRPLTSLELTAIVSIGDWQWNSSDSAYI